MQIKIDFKNYCIKFKGVDQYGDILILSYEDNKWTEIYNQRYQFYTPIEAIITAAEKVLSPEDFKLFINTFYPND